MICVSVYQDINDLLSTRKKYDKKNQKRNKKTKFSAPEFDVDK